MVATAGADGKRGEFEVEYTLGHYPLQQYLVGIGGGRLQALNVAWDSRPQAAGGQRWYHLQAAENIDPQHPFFWTRPSQNANNRCLECHNTDVHKQFDAAANHYQTRWSETGVGCESCHGPGSRHVNLAGTDELSASDSGFDRRPSLRLTWSFNGDARIATPSGDADGSLLDTCGGCHSRRSPLGDAAVPGSYHDQYRLALLENGLYFADGQIDDEVFVMGSFLQSKMYLRGVTCKDCHDPHSGKLIAEDNALCAQCHKAEYYDRSEHHHHQPQSPGAKCANCHMPQRRYMSIDLRADHNFSIPDPTESSRLQTPDACTGCHRDKATDWAAAALLEWGVVSGGNDWAEINHGLRRQDAEVTQQFAQGLDQLSLAPIREATLVSLLGQTGMRLALEAAASRLQHSDPLIRRAAVTALAGGPMQLRWQLLGPLIEDPVASVRMEVASALADVQQQLADGDAERLTELIDEYREILKNSADSPEGQLALGNLELRLGHAVLAERAFLKALQLEPRFVAALVNLADIYRVFNSELEAREVLERALKFAPDNANANHAYGLWLVRAGKPAEALEFLRGATSREDSNPRHAYVYAVALDSLGRTGEAIGFIDRAIERWSNNLDLYALQVAYLEKIGRIDDIGRYLALLHAVVPENPQVRRWQQRYGG